MRMNHMTLFFAALIAAAAFVPNPANAGSAASIPLVWTVYDAYRVDSSGFVTDCTPGVDGCLKSMVTGDHAGSSGYPYTTYSNNAKENNCYLGSPNYDAICKAGRGRVFNFDLGARLAWDSTKSQPVWANPLPGDGPLNVWEVVDKSRPSNTEYDYTTRLVFTLPSSSNGTAYVLVMRSEDPKPHLTSHQWLFDANYNVQTALVRVRHCPDTTAGYSSDWCAAGHKESWLVYPDPQAAGANAGTWQQQNPNQLPPPPGWTPGDSAYTHQVATLGISTAKSSYALAQYSMPFFFRIELK